MDFNSFFNHVQKLRHTSHSPGKGIEPECLALDSECQPTFYKATDEARPLWRVNHGGAAPLGSFQTGAQLEPHPPDSCSGPGLGLAAGASQAGAPGDSDSGYSPLEGFFPPTAPRKTPKGQEAQGLQITVLSNGYQNTKSLEAQGQTVLCLSCCPSALSLSYTHHSPALIPARFPQPSSSSYRLSLPQTVTKCLI